MSPTRRLTRGVYVGDVTALCALPPTGDDAVAADTASDDAAEFIYAAPADKHPVMDGYTAPASRLIDDAILAAEIDDASSQAALLVAAAPLGAEFGYLEADQVFGTAASLSSEPDWSDFL